MERRRRPATSGAILVLLLSGIEGGKSLVLPFKLWLRSILASTYHTLYRLSLPIRWWLADKKSRQTDLDLQLPPAKLRFRVTESTDPAAFSRIGEEASKNLQAVLGEAGYSLENFAHVLDFGCGCGRTLIWLRKQYPVIDWAGTDVDFEAIDWCRDHLSGSTFTTNSPWPPLPFPDHRFDLIYGISVFTHLNEQHQRAWIPEFFRVLQPGGLLLLTFYSEQVWRTRRGAQEVESRGFAFRTSAKLKGVLPEWYQTAFQTQSNMMAMVASHFSVLKMIPGGFGSHDVIIAQRE